MLSIKELYTYPLKSARGNRVEQLTILPTGPEGDRSWMLVDENGRFLSQRQLPKMVLMQVAKRKGLSVLAPGAPPLHVGLDCKIGQLQVQVWDDEVLAVECSHEANAWFTRYLGRPCRLVRVHPDQQRPVDKRFAQEGDELLFADGFPVLFTNQASLDELNSRLATPVQMLNFRPNIVLEGALAYEEDSWSGLEINGILFTLPKPCSRCSIVSVDRGLGVRGGEPLRTLSSYRKFGKRILFGENAIARGTAVLRVGDEVRVVARRDAPHPYFQAPA